MSSTAGNRSRTVTAARHAAPNSRKFFMLKRRLPDGRIVEISTDELNGEFPNDVYEIKRRRVYWGDNGVGYMSKMEWLRSNEAMARVAQRREELGYIAEQADADRT